MTVLFASAGILTLFYVAYDRLSERLAIAVVAGVSLLLSFTPALLFWTHYGWVDLSSKGDVHAYGRAVLSQDLPENATVVGILGEMSLLRFFQETQNIRPDVETIAADEEEARLAAVSGGLERDRAVYLTRRLAGADRKYSLSSSGPLIRVQERPNRREAPSPSTLVDATFGDVRLLGYDLVDTGRLENGALGFDDRRRLLVTLYWLPQDRLNDRLVSLKLLDGEGRLAAQLDRRPVLDAYPTSRWRNGEYIADAYDLPIFTGAVPGEYALQVTLYNPETGEVYGQRELERITLVPNTQPVHRDLAGVQHLTLANLGGVELVGYDLDTTEPFVPGGQIPLTALWRFKSGGAPEMQLELIDANLRIVESHTVRAGESEPSMRFAVGQYLREQLSITLPETTPVGRYVLRLRRAGAGLPLVTTSIVNLGGIEVAAP
jgi:hypothetical protein